jgi:hypothetical protein
MEIKKLTGAVAAATVMFGFGAMAQAHAADSQMFGLQQTVVDPSGEIGYTVTKFLPSGDAVPFPVSGQLYEATVRADAFGGMPAPAVPAFSAQAADGQSYPALAGAWTPQGLSGAPLLPGGHSVGKVYFDAVGEAPTSVVLSGPEGALTWIEPPTAATEEETATEQVAPAEEAPAAEGASGEAASTPAEPQSADSGAADTEANGDVAVADEAG